MYVSDKKSNFSEDNFVKKKILPEMMELVDQYHPEVIWSDGDWEASDDYWQSKEFLSWLYNESPVKNTVVVNDRWGRGIPCHHGDFFTCKDRYNPGKNIEFVFQVRKCNDDHHCRRASKAQIRKCNDGGQKIVGLPKEFKLWRYFHGRRINFNFGRNR